MMNKAAQHFLLPCFPNESIHDVLQNLQLIPRIGTFCRNSGLKERGFKAAYMFFLCVNRVCVSRSKAKDEFKGKTFRRSQCQGRILDTHGGVSVCKWFGRYANKELL